MWDRQEWERRYFQKTKADKVIQRGESEYRTSFTDFRWLKRKDNRAVRFLSNYHDMGYVDKADMLKSLYEISRKSRKFWHRIFWHLVDVTVTNAYIIHSQRRLDGMKLKQFRMHVAAGLIGDPPI